MSSCECIQQRNNRGHMRRRSVLRSLKNTRLIWTKQNRTCIETFETQEEQPSTSIHYQEKTTIIKTALKPRQEKDAYHLFDRPGQVVLARLNAHMHRKLNIVPSTTYPFGEEDQTTEHVLQRCNRHQPERIAHSGHQQLRFTRKYMGAWRTWRRPPTSSPLLDWSCRRTKRRRRSIETRTHIIYNIISKQKI